MKKALTLVVSFVLALTLSAPALAWQLQCAPPGEPMYDARVVLDLSTSDGDPSVINFYSSPSSNAGTVHQQAVILNTLAFVRRDLRPLFDKLPGGQLQVTFAPTVGYAFATGIVLNQHLVSVEQTDELVYLFLHELGHVWDQQLATWPERIEYMESLPWADIVTDWRSDHLGHPQRPIEAYASQFRDDIIPCHWISAVP